MDEVNVRQLRNHGGDVLDRVLRGETLVVTRGGSPVAELRPVPRPAVTSEELLSRWRRIPHTEADGIRRELDDILDPAL